MSTREPTSDSGPTQGVSGTWIDRLLVAGLACLTVMLFWPMTQWMVAQTLSHAQLLHALVVLGLSGVALYMEDSERPKWSFEFDNSASSYLLLCFCFAAMTTVTHWVIFMIAAYCLALAAWVHFFFDSKDHSEKSGPSILKLTEPMITAFGCYLVLLVYFPELDRPLRQFAGVWSAHFLGWMGYQIQLGWLPAEDPRLLLLVGTDLYEVAPECNGFGLMTSGGLLAILLVLYRQRLGWQKAAILLFAVTLALVFNMLRIVAICVLAPSLPGYYEVMHEAVGAIAFWSCLLLIWGVVHQTGKKG